MEIQPKTEFTKSLGKIPYDTKAFFLFALVGIIIKLFFGNVTEDGNSGPATSSIWGYGFMCLALFGLMVTTFGLAYRSQLSKGPFVLLKNILSSSAPIILVIGILTWLIIQNVTYFKRINQGKVPDEYNQFSSISNILIVVQLGILFKFFMDKISTDGETSSDSKMSDILASQLKYIMYILTILNLTVVGLLQVILQFFATDG